MTSRSRLAIGLAGVIVTVVAATLTIGPARRAYDELKLHRAVERLTRIPPPPRSTRLSIAQPPVVRAAMRSGGEAATLPSAFYGALADVAEAAKRQDTPDELRAQAIAGYYSGDFNNSSRDLERLVQSSSNAKDWSDLAAARLEIAIAANAPHAVVPALLAANRALEIEPDLPPALFNRAAALERLGLRLHAKQAWERCLLAEADSVWRERIRERLGATAGEPDDQAWKAAVALLDAGSESEVREAVERFPQDARKAAETALPIDWALRVLARDDSGALAELKRARALAKATRDRSGDRLAAESLAVIDAAVASGRSDRVMALANAYSTYREGRVLYSNFDNARAEIKLRESAHELADANSPNALVARYYAANATLEQHQTAEAVAAYAILAREASERHYTGLASQIAWQIARAEGTRGHWDAALAAATRSVAGFRELGEKDNAGSTENMLAELYDYLGQPERAWEHRAAAFELTSAAGVYNHLQVALAGASRISIRKQDWPTAIAFLDLEIVTSRLTHGDALLVDALARRARAHAAQRDLDAASRDIATARSIAAMLPDAAQRDKAIADIDFAEGSAVRGQRGSRSVQLLSNAIDFYERTSSILLPELYLERGRSYLAAGAENEALSDFATGIGRLESQRATVTNFDLYSTAVDVGEDLFVEAVGLAAKRQDVVRAFDFSERARGRALLQRMRAGDRKPTAAEAGPGVVVIEYMVLPERVIAFTKDRELRLTVLDIDRDALERMVEQFRSSITDERPLDEIRAAGAMLYDRLVRPLGESVRRATTTVFVANKTLERVPWAALYDRESGRYLVEDTVVFSAPSAAALELSDPVRVSRTTGNALVIGNPRISPSFVDLPSLPGSEKEAKAIGRLYSESLVLFGDDATRARVMHLAKDYDVLHFAGHAVSSDASEDQSFLVLAPDAGTADSGVLYSRDIAELPLRNVRLVVLAACGTLRGSTVRLDGMPSIARSFLAAGAGAVIATLWDIDDDQSAALFARIHRRVAAGAPVAQAVRDAQIGAIRSGDARAHPKAWAGLSLVGGLEPANESHVERGLNP